MQLDGVGEIKAELIIKNRPYDYPTDLVEVKGLGEEILSKNKFKIRGWLRGRRV